MDKTLLKEANEFINAYIDQHNRGNELIIPCIPKDKPYFEKASEHPDIQERLRRRGLTLTFKVIDNPQITIAVDDLK